MTLKSQALNLVGKQYMQLHQLQKTFLPHSLGSYWAQQCLHRCQECMKCKQLFLVLPCMSLQGMRECSLYWQLLLFLEYKSPEYTCCICQHWSTLLQDTQEKCLQGPTHSFQEFHQCIYQRRACSMGMSLALWLGLKYAIRWSCSQYLHLLHQLPQPKGPYWFQHHITYTAVASGLHSLPICWSFALWSQISTQLQMHQHQFQFLGQKWPQVQKYIQIQQNW